ncbi:Tol-Pal system beta propeller repeat protein TolB [Ectothiorhodospiraceae bacterium 2226]|nr:Tol-Pal system beta propeller repeat protein TolB [Ectothiorhodospiraceae bacterium 2226]
MTRTATLLAMVLLLLAAHGAWAQQGPLTIEITRGEEGALPIAIVPFGWEGRGDVPEEVAAIVRANLERTGRFAPIDVRDLPSRPREASEVNFRDWRALGVQNLVVGRLQVTGPNRYALRFQLFDVYRGSQLAGYSISASDRSLRRAAHQISDIIYENLTGDRGAFDTHIAYVRVERDGRGEPSYALAVADSDGYNEQVILTSSQPLMSPAWAPDGKRLAYVSFERGRSQVWVQNIVTVHREVVASFDGINSAPAWSPDGRRLALTLSKDGTPDVYVLDLQTRALQRVTEGFAINTEPAWSADGRSIVFTSDRGGRPQLYRIEVNARGVPSGRPQRLTFDGGYNASPSLSPDGRRVAMVHATDNGFGIGVMDLGSRELRVVSDAGRDESPHFAPNGQMIIYATRAGGRGVLEVVSADGRAHHRLTTRQGDVREPAWSPFKAD